MQLQTASALLLLLALLGAAAGRDPSSALRGWLSGNGSSLWNVWNERSHPLHSVYNASPRASDPSYDRCLDDIQHVLDTNALWSFRMLDASVKVPEGLLAFALVHLGNWDECVAVRDVARDERSFHGQMCLVTLSPNLEALGQRNLQPEEVQMLEAASRDTGSSAVLASAQLQLASCVPSSCSAEHVQTLFRSVLFPDEEELEKQPITLTVADSMCTTQDAPSFDASDWVAVGLLSALGLAMVLSTACDVVMPRETKSPLLVSFSVVENGRKLLAPPREGGDQTLSAVHGIRFLSMCWVVMGHRYYQSQNAPNLNPMFLQTFMQDPWRVGITNATVSVDTFFVLSGLLVGYLFFKQTPSKRKINLPMHYIHRYVRLTPAFAVMILINATLLSHVGWGPLWTANVDLIRDGCRDTWWNLLLYVQNFVAPRSNCVGQSWYLMVDMQLYWICALLLLLLVRWPRAAFAAIGALIVANLVGVFVESYLMDFPGNILAATDVDKTMDYFQYYYVSTYSRFVPYLLGLCLGYFLGCRVAEGQKPRQLGPVVAALAWLTVAAMLLVPLFTGTEFLQTTPPGKVPSAFYNSLHRPAWALGMAGLAYLCASGYGGPVNRFLSWAGFQVLGRLSYCVFLVHFSVQTVEIASSRTYSHLSDGAIMAAYASDLLVSFLLAAVLSLASEGPFLALEKQLLGGARKRGAEAGAGAAPDKQKTRV